MGLFLSLRCVVSDLMIVFRRPAWFIDDMGVNLNVGTRLALIDVAGKADGRRSFRDGCEDHI